MATAVGTVAYAIQGEYGLALRSAMGILGPVGKAFGAGIRAIKLGIKVARKRFSVTKGASKLDDGVMSGSAGASRVWTKKGRLKAVGLPTSGKIRFVPPKGYNASNPLNREPNGGFIDRFGNEWVKGPSRTKGQAFEWDVQLSNTGRQQLGWGSRDGKRKHLNISLDGKITHKREYDELNATFPIL